MSTLKFNTRIQQWIVLSYINSKTFILVNSEKKIQTITDQVSYL